MRGERCMTTTSLTTSTATASWVAPRPLGWRLASERGLVAPSQVSFEQHDALDATALAAIRPRPDVVVVSGLYEILLDDVAIRRSLQGIWSLLPSGGLLVLTGQPHHPQLELIGNLLTHRDGSPWRMQV